MYKQKDGVRVTVGIWRSDIGGVGIEEPLLYLLKYHKRRVADRDIPVFIFEKTKQISEQKKQ